MFAFLFMPYIFFVYVRQESGMNTKRTLRLNDLPVKQDE